MAFEWAQEKRITHRSFRIVDLVGNDDFIRDKIFEDCTIYGPAVVVPLGDGTFDHCTFEADPSALFWEIPEGRIAVVGAIGLDSCVFLRCVFRRIGVAGPKGLAEQFVKNIEQG